MKKIVTVILCFFFLVATGCSCSKKEEKEEEKDSIVEITEKTVTSDQIIDGIRFTNTSLVVKNGKTEFRVTLQNTVTTVKKLSHLEIIFKGENGYVIKSVNHYDFNNLKKGDTQYLSFTFSLDMSNVKEIEYKFE